MAKPLITEADYHAAARLLRCSVPAIKAVAEVESRGVGFITVDGQQVPKVLYEAHIFDRLTHGRYRQSHPNLSSKKWDRSLYSRTGAGEHKRLQAAVALDRDAALQSASWGKFQIMGFNWQLVGRDTLQDFLNAQYRSEGEHLKDFAGYVLGRSLDDELRELKWAPFAAGYNGPGYAENRYDEKMAAAYARLTR